MKIKKIKSQGEFVYPATIAAAVKDANFRKEDDSPMTLGEINLYLNEKATGSAIEDSLTSDDGNAALSAKLGKILNDRLEVLENAPSNSVDVKKDTLKFYKQLGKTNADLKEFTDNLRASMIGLDDFAKLGTGLFIHWGVYAVPAGNYTGEKQEGCKVTTTKTTYNTEWIMRDLGIPRNTYKAYETQFTSENWNTNAICKAASEAGMGYVVITAKHHDGFCLYPTEFGSWDVRTSGARETILDELKASCDKYKLKFGVYFSQYWDWMAEGGFGLNHGAKWNGSSTDLYTEAQHTVYCNKTVLQINEMIEKYDPFILWYDPGTNYGTQYINIFAKADESLWPHVITNDRLDYNRNYGDFGTGERTIYVKNRLKYGESCFTMNDTWGYSDNNESKYFGIEKVMKLFMLYSLSYGQNCLMNIGPKADGTIPEKLLECLALIKNFCNSYGKFTNYKRASNSFQPKWGYILELEGNKLLCYIINTTNSPVNTFKLDCISTSSIDSVEILTPGENASYEITDNNIIINNLALDSVTKIGVVRINYHDFTSLLDANLYRVNELVPSRVFLMTNGASWDFVTLKYKLRPSSNITHSTSFIWDSETDGYNLALDITTIDSNPIATDEIITVTIKDSSNTVVSTIVFNYGETSSEDIISLTNGEKYTLTLKCQGTNSRDTYLLNGFTFTPEIIHVTSISLNEESVMVTEEGTAQLIATILPDNATNKTITWTSADESIATVEDGLVIGVAAGETTITATTEDGNKTATCTVIVTATSGEDIIDISEVTLDKSSETLTIGDTLQLTAIISPDNATYKNIRWESNDETIATVDSSGLVTTLTTGIVTIKATSAYNSTKYATCIITINGLSVDSVTLDKSTLTLIPGYSDQLVATISPSNATDQTINWSSSDATIASVDTEGNISAKYAGEVTITATSGNGKVGSCIVTVPEESYDYIFEALSMEATADQGEDTGLKIFSDDMQNWTLFGYVQDNINAYRPGTTTYDTNQTLYQCVVYSSPWSGVRVDANSNYSKVIGTHVPERFRFMAGTDNYVNATTGELMGGSINEDPAAAKHPICFSRNGNTYKFSANGKDWTEFEGLNSTLLTRLKDIALTVGFDYMKSSGTCTTTKYRFLKTESPCCVAFKTITDYPFYSLYHKYDSSVKVTCSGLIINNEGDIETSGITLHPGESYQLSVSTNPRHCTSAIVYTSSNTDNATVSSNGLINYVSTGSATISIVCDTVIKTINVTCESETPTYLVSTNLTGVTIVPISTEIVLGNIYTATLSATDSENTVINEVKILLGTEDVTETCYNSETGIITIDNVTANITITANSIEKHTVTFKSDIQMNIDGEATSSSQSITIDSLEKIKWLNSITNE